ncbi:hypothetical protein RJT34_27737 [Clitoria ternatea]|uniref:Uncharacterized protein n=1 Tax=Clitoria ternatea TaxID=43366 RepID=A0AAN9I9W3_CLITE
MKVHGYTHAAKFVNLFRFRFSTSSSSSSPILSFTTTTSYNKLKLGSARTLLKVSLSPRAFVFQSLASNYPRNFRFSGSLICSGSILGVSIASAPLIAHAMDAGDALVDDLDSQDLSEEEENVPHLWKLARKFWLPVLFFLTVLTNFDDPIAILFIKLTLFLLSTKPNPFSVYIFVDQLCQKSLRQETRILKVKSLYASKVEVQDYKLLCLAAVEVRDQKFTLVGILGSWWTLPHLPSQEALAFVRNRLESIKLKTA